MKRALALLLTFCLLSASCAMARETGETRTVELEKDGLTVYRVLYGGETDTLKYKEEYPAFACADTALSDYLTRTVTEPLLALRRESPMTAGGNAYVSGAKDNIRMSFAVSMDFPGLLSLEASLGNRSADQSINETLFFYRIIDVSRQTELTVYDLFTEPREAVDLAVREAVFGRVTQQGAATVTEAAQVPAPNSYYLSKDVFRCLFAAGAVTEKAVAVDIPWADLKLSQSALLTDNAPLTVAGAADSAQDAEPADTAGASDAQTAPDSGTGEIDGTADTDGTSAQIGADALPALLTQHDWKTGNRYLRFAADGSVSDPAGGEPMFISYAIRDGVLYLNAAEREDQGATVSGTAAELTLRFDPETSDFETLTLTAASLPASEPAASEPAASAAADLSTPAPAGNVATPTPMPVTGADADMVAFLTAGLWKPLGTDGTTYYQFTADGKLLTVQVSDYTVTDGALRSDAIAGDVALGGTAFTVTSADGTQEGYVLNRSATPIRVEEFVTPTPAPPPTATPVPTPTPTPSPTPSPSPTPTPTLSPYEQAAQTAPTLATLGDASFAKRQSLKVYSAPDEKSYRESKAQVTTDETVGIFGVTNGWVLVSYAIGNGSRGRIGYIDDATLADPENVANLTFANIKLTLGKSAKATDDPLRGKATLFTLKKDTEVQLLAFLETDWAYVETTYKSKVCRVFIPRSALIAE